MALAAADPLRDKRELSLAFHSGKQAFVPADH